MVRTLQMLPAGGCHCPQLQVRHATSHALAFCGCANPTVRPDSEVVKAFTQFSSQGRFELHAVEHALSQLGIQADKERMQDVVRRNATSTSDELSLLSTLSCHSLQKMALSR